MRTEVELIPEHVVRNLDNVGRITLPKGLRDRIFYGIEAPTVEIYTMRCGGVDCVVLASRPLEEKA